MIRKKNILAMALAISIGLPTNWAFLASIVAPITVFAQEGEVKTATILLCNTSNEPFKKEDNTTSIIFTVKVADDSKVTAAEYKYFLPKGFHYIANPTMDLTKENGEDNFKLVVAQDTDSYSLENATGKDSSLYIQYQVKDKDYVQLTKDINWNEEGKVSAKDANEALQTVGVYASTALTEIEKLDSIPISYQKDDENPTIIGYRYDVTQVENCVDLDGATATLKNQIVYQGKNELTIPDLTKNVQVKVSDEEGALSNLAEDLEVVLPTTITSTPIGKEVTGKLGVKADAHNPYKYKNAEKVEIKYTPLGNLADENTVIVTVKPTDPTRKIELQPDGYGGYIFDPSSVTITFKDDNGHTITASLTDYEVEASAQEPGPKKGKVTVKATDKSKVFINRTSSNGEVDVYVNVNSNAIGVRLDSTDPYKKAFTVTEVTTLEPKVIKVIFGPETLAQDNEYTLTCKKGDIPIKVSDITETDDYTLTIAGVEENYFTGTMDISFTVIPEDAIEINLASTLTPTVDTTKKYVLTKEAGGKLSLNPAPTITVTKAMDDGEEVTVDSTLYDFVLDAYPIDIGNTGGSGKIVSSGKQISKEDKTYYATGIMGVQNIPVYGDLSSDLAEIELPYLIVPDSATPSSIVSNVYVWYNNKLLNLNEYAVNYKDSTGTTLEDSEFFSVGTYTVEITPKDENSYCLNSKKLILEIDANGETTVEEVIPEDPSDAGGSTGGDDEESKPSKPTNPEEPDDGGSTGDDDEESKPSKPTNPEEPDDGGSTGGDGGGSKPLKPIIPEEPDAPAPPVVGTPTTMYRLYNRLTGEHFFTTNKDEHDSLLTSDTWSDEGQGWTSPSVSDFPVYRLLNPNTTDHHYTTDQNEYDVLQILGWIGEGTAFYSADKDNPENVQLHRLYNPNAKEAGSHQYTADVNERDMLVALGWKYEGLAWAGLPTE